MTTPATKEKRGIGSCLKDSVFLPMIYGTAPIMARLILEAHLKKCKDCRKRLRDCGKEIGRRYVAFMDEPTHVKEDVVLKGEEGERVLEWNKRRLAREAENKIKGTPQEKTSP